MRFWLSSAGRWNIIPVYVTLELMSPRKAAALFEQPGSVPASPREMRRGKSKRHNGLVSRVQIILSLMHNEERQQLAESGTRNS